MENTLLNLIPAAYLPEIHLSQYDVGRTITFTLKDGASDYSVPSGASVKVKATKPSGFGFEVACTFNGGTVTLVTTDTMTPESGRFPAELSIVSGNTTIGTSNFIFNIERSPHPEGTIDGDAETIIPELTLLVERIEAAAEDVDEKAELFLNLSAEAETLPAGSLATANYSDGVLTLGIPRGYDGDDTKADAIVKSASGEVASFTDGGNGLLVKSLIANITPKQSGSGDPSPSNVRPISGTDTVNVNVCGVNVWDEEWEVGNIDSQGNNSSASNRIRSKNYVPVMPNTQYYIKSPSGLYIWGYDSNKTFIGRVPSGTLANGVITIPNNCYYIRFIPDYPSYGTTYNNDISINYPATDTSYHIGANNESYPISLGQTVYGGTLEVCSGKLAIDTGYIEFDGSSDEVIGWNGGNSLASLPVQNAFITDAITQVNAYTKNNMFKDVAWTKRASADGTVGLLYGNSYLFLKYSQITDEATTRTFLASHPLQVAYKLQNPTTIQLTPTQVKTLLGNNNIFADSGSVEVEYRADTTLAYNELLSLIASLS